MSETSYFGTLAAIGEFSLSHVRWGSLVLVAVFLPSVIIELRNASTRPFWFDELFTVAIAALGTPSAIWNALLTAVDSQPPLFYFFTHIASFLSANEQLAYRIPALFGYFCTLFCVYAFVERRVGFAGGLMAALVASLSGLHVYAVEARPYGLELGFLALGLLFWQKLENSKWFSIPFALCLATAVALHYYAILVVPALFLAEAFHTHRTRKVRWAVWCSLFCMITPLILASAHIRLLRTTYGPQYWSHANLSRLLQSYLDLTSFGALTAGVVIVLFTIMLTRLFPTSLKDLLPRRFVDQLTAEECVLVAYLLLLPVPTYLAAKLTQGGLIMRYVLPSALGLAIGGGFSITWLGRRATIVLLAILAASYSGSLVMEVKLVLRDRSAVAADNSSSRDLEQLLQRFPSPRPVVVSSPVDYLPLAHYGSSELAARILTVVDEREAISAVGTDQVDHSAALFRRYDATAKIEQFANFRATTRHFLLFSTGTTFDWWPQRLSREGHLVKLRHSQGQNRLYEVELVNQERVQ
jgi:hypothetical protein